MASFQDQFVLGQQLNHFQNQFPLNQFQNQLPTQTLPRKTMPTSIDQFKLGGTAKLKSGGHTCTVMSTIGDKVTIAWFDDSKVYHCVRLPYQCLDVVQQEDTDNV